MGAIRDLHMSPQIFFTKSWECVVFRYLTIPHSTTSSLPTPGWIPDELEIVKLTFESLELFGLVVVGSSVTSMQEKPTSTWQKSLGFVAGRPWMCQDLSIPQDVLIIATENWGFKHVKYPLSKVQSTIINPNM